MAHLQVSLLGAFQARLDGQLITTFRSSNVQAMLVYLIMQAGQPLNRQVLTAFFWPDETSAVAGTNFRQALYQLRKVLAEKTTEKPFLLVTRQTVKFNTAAHYDLDVATFLQALQQEQLDTAVSLYKDELLPGFSCDSLQFEEWLRVERERLHQLALNALSDLTEKQLDQSDYVAAQATARR